MSLKERIRFIL